MLKNPFRIFKRKQGKSDSDSNKFCDIKENEEVENEALDEATEALEDLFITGEIEMESEEPDEDLRSQSSEASTIALLASRNHESGNELENSDTKNPKRFNR